MRRAAALLVLGLACRSSTPRDVTLADGTFAVTLPAGWDFDDQKKPTFHLVRMLGPERGGGACVFTFTHSTGPTQPAQYVTNFLTGVKKRFDVEKPGVPEQLETGLGPFDGERVGGKWKADNLLGAVSQLAGEVTLHAHGGANDDTYVGVMIATTPRVAGVDHYLSDCRSIARSLRPAVGDAGAAAAR